MDVRQIQNLYRNAIFMDRINKVVLNIKVLNYFFNHVPIV